MCGGEREVGCKSRGCTNSRLERGEEFMLKRGRTKEVWMMMGIRRLEKEDSNACWGRVRSRMDWEVRVG